MDHGFIWWQLEEFQSIIISQGFCEMKHHDKNLHIIDKKSIQKSPKYIKMYFFSFIFLIYSWLIERIENNHRHTFRWSCDRCYWESNAPVLFVWKHRKFDKSNGNNWRSRPNQCERRHLQVSFIFSYIFYSSLMRQNHWLFGRFALICHSNQCARIYLSLKSMVMLS